MRRRLAPNTECPLVEVATLLAGELTGGGLCLTPELRTRGRKAEHQLNRGLSVRVWTLALIFGVTEALGAVFWLAVAAAGLRGTELANVLAFLLMGPLSALPAAIVALWNPKWGAMWLMAGGLVSSVLAVPYFSTDAGVFPVLLCSLPMLIVGGSLLRVCTNGSSKHNAHATEHHSSPRVQRGEKVSPAFPGSSGRDTEAAQNSLGPQGQEDQGAFIVPVTGILLFLVGWIGTLFLSMVLATFLRDLLSHRLPHEANAVGLLLSGCVITLITFVRKRLALRTEFVIGMWIALLSYLVLLNYQ